MDMHAKKYQGWHPMLSYCTTGASPYTFIFQKPRRTEQDPAALKEWEANEKIVRAHGGRMLVCRSDAGTEAVPPFTEREVEEIKVAISKRFPELEVYTHWNGAASHSLSVGARARRDSRAR